MTAASSVTPALDVSSPRTPAYVVTLIHGTYPGKRKWTQTDSELCRTLSAQLEGGVEFRCVKWSGANRAGSRLKAAKLIHTELEQALGQYPHASHFVIAHSHGGNAAMYALRDKGLQRRLAGIITLATPFLHVGGLQINERSVRDAVRLLLVLGVTCLIAALLSVLLTVDRTVYIRYGLDVGIYLLAVGFIGLIIAAVFVPSARSKRRNDERLVKQYSKLQAELALPERLETPVLILRTTGDEASATLAMSQLMSWLVALVARPVAWGMDKANPEHQQPLLRRSKNEKLCYLVMLLIAWVASVYFLDLSDVRNVESVFGVSPVIPAFLLKTLVTAVIILGLSLIALWVLFKIALAFLLVLRSLAMTPFGADVALASMLLDVSAEATPPGPWQILHVPASSSTSASLGWLAHSRIYNDSIAISAIVNFIQQTVRNRSRLVLSYAPGTQQ